VETRINTLMDEAGLSQADVAVLLRRDPSTVSRKLSGERPITIAEANEILDVLSQRLGRRITFEESFGADLLAPTEAGPEGSSVALTALQRGNADLSPAANPEQTMTPRDLREASGDGPAGAGAHGNEQANPTGAQLNQVDEEAAEIERDVASIAGGARS
jgi:transcriptional regulator with XRE-family HTH domain